MSDERPAHPYPNVDPQPSFPEIERNVLERWKAQETFARSVERQHREALVGEEHGGRGAGAASADHDHVVARTKGGEGHAWSLSAAQAARRGRRSRAVMCSARSFASSPTPSMNVDLRRRMTIRPRA